MLAPEPCARCEEVAKAAPPNWRFSCTQCGHMTACDAHPAHETIRLIWDVAAFACDTVEPGETATRAVEGIRRVRMFLASLDERSRAIQKAIDETKLPMTCGCGGEIGFDVTDRLACYECAPEELLPKEVLTPERLAKRTERAHREPWRVR